jgi:NAD(P)H-dependent FMN reductase
LRVLAISGSLRARSANTGALLALEALAPAEVEIAIYKSLADLPAFNPDDDEEGAMPPAAVQELRSLVEGCDGLFITAPEYAHGVPGALKNALDWLVASEAFSGKPVALINCAPRAFHAQAQLRETLATMAAQLIPDAFAILPVPPGATDAQTILADARCAGRLREALAAFRAAIDGGERRSTGP